LVHERKSTVLRREVGRYVDDIPTRQQINHKGSCWERDREGGRGIGKEEKGWRRETELAKVMEVWEVVIKCNYGTHEKY
jgi:hypothetical protein